jgi:T-complex protein 1 subunit eta
MSAKLDQMEKMGVNLILSMHPVCTTTRMLIKWHKIIFLGNVPENDLQRTMRACGGSIITTFDDINQSSFGTCQYFNRNVYPNARYLTLIFRL